MAIDCTLSALLEADQEPTPATYKATVDKFIERPEQISCLTETDVQENVLLQLTIRSHRLVRFFHCLRPVLQANPKFWPTSHIAIFLVQILPALHQLLSPTKVLELLTPALELCLAPSQPPPLRKLASVIADCGRLLEYLASDPYGSQVLCQWACTLGTSVLDTPILELWIERLVEMVGSCNASQDVAQTIQKWDILRTLKKHLRILEAEHSEEISGPMTRNVSVPLSSMTQLSTEDKKTRCTGGKDPQNNIPTLDDNTKRHLRVFDLLKPRSWAALRNVIERLEGDETSKAFLSIATHFPCELCIQGLGSSPQTLVGRVLEERIGAVSNLQIEILGKALGVWQILLSAQALRSLQEMSLIGPVGEKLKDLASGCWNTTLTGTEAQRKRLKVPLFSTEYGQNKVILWQVSIGLTRDLQVPEQVITVWEVGRLSEMDKVFDSVALLQRSYSPEVVRRCRHRPSVQDKRPFPARFEDSVLHSAMVCGLVANLDVRTVDQGTIDMANKFYGLTEPTFRAILANDLLAEFPFDLSKEEARVISHFQTASLILGRSGTGKTTCLIFKLVGKYLTSKAVIGEKPVKQVLLTRSSFLADKLRAYTRGLIKTLESKSVDVQSLANGENSALTPLQEDLEEQSVSTLNDDSFPLVLTFDGFLRILENTAEVFNRKSASKPEASRYRNPAKPGESATVGHRQQRQLVDFPTFKLDYWPRFPQHLTRKLGVNLVFAEIMGVIKGSSSSGQSLAPLTRQEYLDRSCRLAPVFAVEDDRSLVYDIFERYEDMKQEHQDVDNVDRVVRMMSAIRRNTSLRQLLESAFDEVYIDEVQDQRCVDVQFLLQFIKDSRGLHFAGDTAQAISQDSTFRFSDIKAIIYEHFAPASAYANQSQLARPSMFTFSKNYRSHQRILALASLVMGMIWKGFPETVDKLEPEVGNLDGPKPVLFLGCDASILRTSNVGLVNLSDRVADFGAEQVILVRDECMKTKLQGEIGDIALILTILESKGMEFDDVMLWDFFTSSPDPSGLRSLSALTADARSVFDAQRHSGMCSELKHLYVAVTRARIQFFLIESSEKAMVSIVKLLTLGSPEPLVDITRPHEGGFQEKLKMLRPGTSVDPVRWSLRGQEFMQLQKYQQAVFCFRKAKNHRGETIANGKLCEEKGRECQGKNDVQGFTQNLEEAIKLFLETNMIGDAAKNLERLARFQDAAELWLQHNEFAKAAPLFVEAGLYVQAANCHHIMGNHSGAAAVLRQGEKYNELVSYLDENRGNIPADTLQGYSLFCKLLLKQKKTSPEGRNHAIRVLGSSAEQEKCFLEYGMVDDLAELFASQMRHEDLFHLHKRNGQLERALRLAITEDLLQSTANDLEPEVLSLLDYVCAGHLERNRLQHTAGPLRLPSGYLTPDLILRAEQWEASNLVYSLEGSIACQKVAGMSSTVPKTLLCLRKILDATTITQVTKLDDLPFEMMQEAVKFAKDLVLDKDSNTLKTMLLLAGLWKPESGKGRYIVLPWSPLREALTEVSDSDPIILVMQRILEGLMSAILALDAKARDLWQEKWPKRCVQFMTIGFCPRKQKGEECHWLHQLYTADDCSRILDDLLRMNSIFCDMAIFYYRRSMNKTFQEKYLGIKRHWLERLLRELTYLSSVEQHASAIMRTQVGLFHEKGFIAIASFLEDLLYFRLGNEWRQRSDFTSLLEQIQLAKAFGPNVQHRLFRALSTRLLYDQRGLLQSHLGLLNSLTENSSRWNASFFQNNLNIFLGNLDNVEVPAFSTLHSLTAVFEYFAAYLLLKTCVTACVLPNSWIDLHVASISNIIHHLEPLQGDDKHRYQECIIQLAKSFYHILSRLNKAFLSTDFLLCSGTTHQSLLLRQRNAELVAILVANLAATSPQQPIGINEIWARAKEVFEYDLIKAFHVRSRTTDELTQKLAPSLAKSNGKDALVVVIKDRNKSPAFAHLEHQPGVTTVAFDHLCPRPRNSAAADDSPYQSTLPTSADGAQEQYSTAETEAMIKIQRLWRSCSVKINRRRSYVSVPVHRATARFFNLGAQCFATVTSGNWKAILKLCMSHGVALSLRLDSATGLLSKLQEDAMTCIENVEISPGVDRSVDYVLGLNRDVDVLLQKAKVMISDGVLAAVVQLGDVSLLEGVMMDVEALVAEAECGLLETEKIIVAVSNNSTT